MNEHLNDLAQQPGQAWLSQLANDPKAKVRWRQTSAAAEHWDYSHDGLTPEAAGVIAIVVAYASAGAANGAAESIVATTGATGVTATVATAAVAAGLTTLSSQASLALINNKGDLAKTLDDMGRSENTKALVTAMLTAGLMQGVAGTDFMQTQQGQGVTETAIRNMTNAAVRTSMNVALNGGSLKDQLGASLQNALIDTLAGEGEHALHLDTEVVKQLNSQITSKLGHALLGCAVASANHQDCASGAVGDVTGELVGELYLNGRDLALLSDNDKQVIKDKAKLIAAVVSFSAGLNPDVAASAGLNSVENNTLYLHNGYVVARDKQDNDKVIRLSDKDASKFGMIDYEASGLGGVPLVSDDAYERLSGSTVFDLNNLQDFELLRKGTDMGYYEGKGRTRIYFQNGMENTLENAKLTANLISVITGVPVGVIANGTHGIANDTEEYLHLPYQTKDVLNEFTYRKLNQVGEPTLIVMHSAGNKDALQALKIGSLYGHQYPNLDFYSLGSPIGRSTLGETINNVGADFVGQTNDWRDPVTYSKTVSGGILGAAGSGALYGCSFGPLGCLAGAATGAGAMGAPALLGIANYHPMTNYLGKPEVVNTLQRWPETKSK